VSIGKNVKVINTKIIVFPDCSIEIGDDVNINNAEIIVSNGKLLLGNNIIIRGKSKQIPTQICVDEGSVVISHHSIISAKKLWIRFGGVLKIGSYTNINAGTEVRCDEKILIGSYCQISYNIRIWDTNTHNIYDVNQRRQIAEKYFPFLGKEFERPITKPVIIGDDCWLGENSAVLKGSTIGNAVNIGFHTTISGQFIPNNHTVVTDIKLKVFES
jgi:acetyltransferase-like isoleucine patch superfamily enzyme